MAGARPAASLTGSLLARRGGARPAMRRATQFTSAPAHDDLGWNDMGDNEGIVVPIQVAAVVEPREAFVAPIEEAIVPASPVAEQIAVLAERIKVTPSAKKVVRARPATLSGTARKAAFTLRIDAERHLRLRLLSAMTRRSSQQLLIEALDTMIVQNEQLRELADQIEAGQNVTDATGKLG
jgi:predicted transcriptional regulator